VLEFEPKKIKERASSSNSGKESNELAKVNIQQRHELKNLLAASTSVKTAQACLEKARLIYIGDDPLSTLLLLQIRERAGDTKHLIDDWANLIDQAPHDMTIFSLYFLRLVARRQVDKACELLELRLPKRSDEPLDVSIRRAELLDSAKLFEQADDCFKAVLSVNNDSRQIRVNYAKLLRKRGWIIDAIDILEPIRNTLAKGTMAKKLLDDVDDIADMLLQYETRESLKGHDFRIFTMKNAILHFRNRVTRPIQNLSNKKIVFATGSLGAGGAERQMSKVVIALKNRAAALADDNQPPMNNLQVIVRSHSNAVGSDFFLPDLRAADIPVTEFEDTKPSAAANQNIPEGKLLRLLEHLPPPVHFGVTRFLPVLSKQEIDVVSLWQDGACLWGALPALLQGVPVIQLMFRGLPPNLRTHRTRPEYKHFYQALAQIPNVRLMTNSYAVAKAYSEWLDVPLDHFEILYNAISSFKHDADSPDEQKWKNFLTRTPDATDTIGGVFRLEPDKSPLNWVKLCHKYLASHPNCRFVIVGSGSLLPAAQELAEKIGIANKILFVGQTHNVSFWYSRMDIKVLLSRFEGLPNALIEAQYHGIPVVSTPAGGASECFIEGRTGHILSCAITPSLDEAVKHIANMIRQSRLSQGIVANEASEFVKKRFNLDAVIDKYISLLSDDAPPFTMVSQ
jgi:glycosyltransferase involved in cell wall biosynthesis